MQKALAMWILLAAGGGGQPEVSPTQVVQTATEHVLQVVQDAELAAPAVQERRRVEVQRIADRLFDFPEMARRALAVHWRDRTPQEQGEFVVVFKQLLARAYLGKLENYSGEQIVYSRGAEIPVDYRLHLVGARWAVYDVAVQGVSFVANYRGQFDKVIRTSSYPSLMRELRAKYAQATGRATVGATPIPAAPALTPIPTAAPATKPEE